jgi:hypothetical protein
MAMEAEILLNVCGSITKTESLLWLKTNILAHTYVAEANIPYATYYGGMPEKAEPNSLFLFTERYYTLEESLSITQSIEFCSKHKVNAASALLKIKRTLYPAIRIRNFPDYEHLEMLQQCYQKRSIRFAKNVKKANEALVTVNKCFSLEKMDESVFLDNANKNEGYIRIPRHLNQSEFDILINNVRNNNDCISFDAARGGLIINGTAIDIVRIYSEHLDYDLLKCVNNILVKQFENLTVPLI